MLRRHFSTPVSASSLSDFQAVTVDDITSAIRRLTSKHCVSEPIPSHLLVSIVDDTASFLTALYNNSLHNGVVPESNKSAYISSLLKKSNLDLADVKSYRPISNLSVTSKLLEILVAKQMVSHLKAHDLLSRMQSAYRRGHATVTAVTKVLSDIFIAIDRSDFAALALSLTAAFDTVDNDILLKRLHSCFGVSGRVLS